MHGDEVSRANEVYRFDRSTARALKRLKSDVNYSSIVKYHNQRTASGLSPARLYKCLNTLSLVSKDLKKKFEDVTKDEMVGYFAKMEQKDVSGWTKHDYKVIVKKFYQWLYGCDVGEYPEVVRWVRTGYRMSNNLKKSDLLTTEEIKRLAESAQTLRDKAFILVLAESGRRVGEILTLRIENIEFDNIGARLLVDGKTGRDYVRIMSSAPLLATWLDNHPKRDDPKSPVWVTSGRFGIQQIRYTSIRQMMKNCVKRSGLKKRIWFHLFRHSRGTEASTKLNSQQLCALMGWKQGSDMPSIYVHLAGEDIDQAQAVMNGIKIENENKSSMQYKICNRCDHKNSFISKFCNRCGLCLDIKTAMQVDKAKGKIEDLFDRLSKDPEKLEKIIRTLQT